MGILDSTVKNLPPAAPLTGSELVYIVQNGQDARTTTGAIFGFVPGAFALVGVAQTWTAFQTFSAGLGSGASAASWLNTYLPGVSGAGAVMDFSVGPAGVNLFSARVSAFRSSDNPSGSTQSSIADVALAVADNTSVAHILFPRYTEGWIPSTGKFALFINEESSLANYTSTSIAMDPFGTYGTGGTLGASINLRLGSGIGGAPSSNDISAFIHLVNTGGQAINGIVFASNSLDTGGGYAGALTMATNHGIEWYSASATRAWRIFSNSGAANVQGQMILGNGTLDLFLGASSAHALAITTTNVGIGVASSFTGTMTGPDGGTWSSTSLNLSAPLLQMNSVNTIARNVGTGALTISTNAAGLILTPATGVMVGTVTDPGAGNLAAQGVIIPGLVAIASLPSPTAALKGATATVSNGQTTPAFMGTVSATGTTVAPVFCNGSAWLYG